jgi:hypothetical protein
MQQFKFNRELVFFLSKREGIDNGVDLFLPKLSFAYKKTTFFNSLYFYLLSNFSIFLLFFHQKTQRLFKRHITFLSVLMFFFLLLLRTVLLNFWLLINQREHEQDLFFLCLFNFQCNINLILWLKMKQQKKKVKKKVLLFRKVR